jgi:hypothetical protein
MDINMENYINYIDNNSFIYYPDNNLYPDNQDVILIIYLTKDHLNLINYINEYYDIQYNECDVQYKSQIYKYIVEIKNIHILEFLFDIFNNNLNNKNNSLYNNFIYLYKNQKKYFYHFTKSIFI